MFCGVGFFGFEGREKFIVGGRILRSSTMVEIFRRCCEGKVLAGVTY